MLFHHLKPVIVIPGQMMSSPIVISTWDHGLAANIQALDTLDRGGSALDAGNYCLVASRSAF